MTMKASSCVLVAVIQVVAYLAMVKAGDGGGPKLSRKYCVISGQTRGKDGLIRTIFGADAHQCFARCNREPTCLSFESTKHQCSLFTKRTTGTSPSGGTDYYIRLNKGATCPGGSKPYVHSAVYTKEFCTVIGKRCPSDKLTLYRRPLAIKTMEACQAKCAKIRTCGGLNFFGKCVPISQQCQLADLVIDATATYALRLRKGQSCQVINKSPETTPVTEAPAATESETEAPAVTEPETEAPSATEPEPATEAEKFAFEKYSQKGIMALYGTLIRLHSMKKYYSRAAELILNLVPSQKREEGVKQAKLVKMKSLQKEIPYYLNRKHTGLDNSTINDIVKELGIGPEELLQKTGEYLLTGPGYPALEKEKLSLAEANTLLKGVQGYTTLMDTALTLTYMNSPFSKALGVTRGQLQPYSSQKLNAYREAYKIKERIAPTMKRTGLRFLYYPIGELMLKNYISKISK